MTQTMATSLLVRLIILLLAWTNPQAVPWPIGGCVAPATCTAPPAKHSVVRPVPSRQQWLDSGGYCGALAVQAIAQSYGIWMSQDQVRKSVENSTHGQMIMHYNIQKALDALKLTHNDWDWKHAPQPQSEKYLTWLKKELAAGHPVVWMITTKEFGDLEDTEKLGLPIYTHIEPVWGIYSNYSLEDLNVYPSDVLVHGADYGANRTVEGPKLYRRFDSLVDNIFMRGNCSKAVSGIGHNEYYPCIMQSTGIGYSITGVLEPEAASLPLSLAVNSFDEPDFPWKKDSPVQFTGTVTIQRLVKGTHYTLLRWDDYRKVPTDGTYMKSDYDHKYTFVAEDTSHMFVDPNTFSNSGVAYYRCVQREMEQAAASSVQV